MPEPDLYEQPYTESDLLNHLLLLIEREGDFRPDACAVCREVEERRNVARNDE